LVPSNEVMLPSRACALGAIASMSSAAMAAVGRVPRIGSAYSSQ